MPPPLLGMDTPCYRPERASDDGEPGGSAGRPILAQIIGHELNDLLVVVSRYYGGTKLGVGGLIRAYGGTAGKALDTSRYRVIEERMSVRIEFDYAFTKGVEAVLRQYSIPPPRHTTMKVCRCFLNPRWTMSCPSKRISSLTRVVKSVSPKR